MKKELSEKIKERIIDANDSLLSALKQMDRIDKKLLFVFNDAKFINILSIGDIQRAIIKNIPLNTVICEILRQNTRLSFDNDSCESIKQRMLEYRTECMPVLNKNNDLVDVYFWEDVFGKEQKREIERLNLPVVIMAGGKGNRLKPITNILPKPLIPIGEKTIMENIMDRFVNAGCNNFFISLNYKAEMIKHYFDNLKNPDYNIFFFQETKPLGTVGSLFMLKDKIKQTFLVSNCDIIINEDYSEIIKYHKNNKNELTIVAALKHYSIPYGTITTGNNGVLLELIEKPELTFQINSGMYILESHLLNEIPENEFFHITHLIEKILQRKAKVGVFPVSEGSWKDVGGWDEYLKQAK